MLLSKWHRLWVVWIYTCLSKIKVKILTHTSEIYNQFELSFSYFPVGPTSSLLSARGSPLSPFIVRINLCHWIHSE